MYELGRLASNLNAMLVSGKEMTLRELLVSLTSEDDVREAERQVYLFTPGTHSSYVSPQRACFVGHLIRRSVVRAGQDWEKYRLPGAITAAVIVSDDLQRNNRRRIQPAALVELMEIITGWNDDGRFVSLRDREMLLRTPVEVRVRRGVDGEFTTVAIARK